jgi:hypothetical protein
VLEKSWCGHRRPGQKVRDAEKEGITMRPTRVISLAASAVLGLSLALTALLASAAPISEAAVAPAAVTSPMATLSQTVIPINQVNAGVGTLTGTFTPTQFVNQNGQLGLQGLFQGSLAPMGGGAATRSARR